MSFAIVINEKGGQPRRQEFLKGEITIVVSGKKRSENRSNNLEESDKKKIRLMINKNSVKDIVNLIHKERNISKKKIYDFCIREKK